MRLLHRYLAKEILLPFAAGLLFLTQILLATQLLAQADVLFGSGVSIVDVGAVVLYLLPYFLAYVLPIAFLLGAVLGVGRLAEDREVVALGAAGFSPAFLVPVPLAIAVAVAGVGLWLSLEAVPTSLDAARVRLNEIVKRNVMNDVRPGTFYDQIPGYTLYAERVRHGRWENVLISDRSDPSAPVLALARGGRLEPVGAAEEMRLVLEDGEVHREQVDSDEYVLASFRRADVVLGLGTALSDRNSVSRTGRDDLAELHARIAQARAKGDAAAARRAEASLHRRIASPLAVIPFALLAVPLGASRRAGRAFGVGATFLVVVAHYLLLRGGEVMAQRGALPAALALQLPTIVLSAVALALIAIQVHRGTGAVR
ncbi:MAG TPA: LptF/LptG family permease [Anaeromyxobacter sp.]|nr:LptF/LptG family permease [Anaeromyxobacter sp.]